MQGCFPRHQEPFHHMIVISPLEKIYTHFQIVSKTSLNQECLWPTGKEEVSMNCNYRVRAPIPEIQWFPVVRADYSWSRWNPNKVQTAGQCGLGARWERGSIFLSCTWVAASNWALNKMCNRESIQVPFRDRIHSALSVYIMIHV